MLLRACIVLAFGVQRNLEGGNLFFGDFSDLAQDVPDNRLGTRRGGEGTKVSVILSGVSLDELSVDRP